ncbi:unnamed protein product [Urochloa decumbens]|uniref:Major facilitator superfamily (MFS) profile domain-containing protein n=1 Tax=Urochloa decumbens TaxID=240449 RepID=A0ABC9AIQ0_9POAL
MCIRSAPLKQPEVGQRALSPVMEEKGEASQPIEEMAKNLVVVPNGGPAPDYGGGLTFSVVMSCLVAASGGLIFGYDIGISGGVSKMEAFLKRFFPHVLKRMAEAKKGDNYCIYDSQALAAFTSSLYIAGLVASLVASRVTRALGRQAVMLMGGAFFFAGAALTGAAVNISMLIVGRMLLGVGVGFTNQATPLFLAEMAPPRWRGALTCGIQFFLTRLLMRGQADRARAVLLLARGGADAGMDAELKEISRTVKAALESEDGAFRRMTTRRGYRPYLVFAVALPVFTQLTGVIVLSFFSPLLFRTVGFGSDAALMGAIILGAVNMGSLLVSTLVIDRYGRKVLFMVGGVQMVLCQIFPVDIRSLGQAINMAICLGLDFVQTQSFLAMLCRFRYATFAYYAAWVAVMTVFVALLLPETKGVPLESMPMVWTQHWLIELR